MYGNRRFRNINKKEAAMKKLIPILFAAIFFCIACGKTSSTESEEEKWEREMKEVYSYETPFIFSQERVENEVEYIDGMDALVDEAVKTIRERMQKGHYTGDWMSGVWDSGLGYYPTDFDGKGYYICRIPITTYNNNRNSLLDTFTLLIFNEDKSIAGDATFSKLNNRVMEVDMMPVSNYFKELQTMPDIEFINIHANYLRDNYSSNPNLIGGIEPRAEAYGMLGEDNKVYAYDHYSGKMKEVNKLNLFDGKSIKIDGDIFHSLPEEMRYSYKKIIDNLIWVEYNN